jgi:hypothetical protein
MYVPQMMRRRTIPMKRLILRTVVVVLAFQLLLFGSTTAVHAQDTTCPEHMPVTIDIKPADTLNNINLSAKGWLPVALLTTDDFNASEFTPEMAHLSDASMAMMGCVHAPFRWNLDDVNSDGRLDIVFFFRIQDLHLTSSSTAARLMAHGSYSSDVIHIQGTDSVQVKP